jgi:hypothetical protein
MSFINTPDQLAPAAASFPKPSIWQRLLESITDGQHKASEQAWSDLIARNGGRLTDEIERQITLHL